MTVWHEEPISKKHDREAFDCGDEALNEFLRRYACNSHEMGGAKTFLAIDDADVENACMRYIPGSHVLGHLTYTLSENDEANVLNQTVAGVEKLGPREGRAL